MRSRAQWGFLFATGKPFARRWARSTPGGKGKRYRKLPGHVKKEAPLIALLKANYGAKKGQVITGRLVRGEGGRFSSSGAAPASSPKQRAAGGGKRLPVAKKPVVPKKTPLTPEQRAEASATARQEKLTAKRAARDRILTEAGIDKNLQGALIDAMDGNTITPTNGAELAKRGLAEKATDGSYHLNASARTVMHAASRGDAGMVNDMLSKAKDRAAAAEPPAAGGGGGKKKEPPVKVPTRQTSKPVKPSGGGGGGAAKKPTQPRPPQPQTSPELVALARRLSAGEPLADDEAQTLIRNGLARKVKGELVLSASGARAIRTKAASPLMWLLARKAAPILPTRTLNAGHTGVMVALHPDVVAVRAITASPGVTEPTDQLHLTLAYLGDSTEQPLATNKARLIDTVKRWALARSKSLKGTINGAGRFFHSEADNTNAVWVAPDVAGLPELRQSLVEAIEAAGFDYSQDHGFTPHITVAYVAKDAPAPSIRIDTPVTFDRVTLAWGDERYDFPLGAVGAKAGNPADYLVVEDRTKPSTWHLQVKKSGKPDHRRMGGAWAALHGGYRGNKYEGPQKGAALTKLKRLYVSEGMVIPTEKAWRDASDGQMLARWDGEQWAAGWGVSSPSFTVYKSHDGTPRWIARSTTAYRDRDREILPIAVLDADSQRMTATKQYGPLRWWHVGQPNALDPAAPWGPGLDLGVCDFSMQIGRTRIESGTFKDAAVAARIAATADQYELSPGFFHAADQPDSAGVFGAIHTFERSLVPIAHGRASNLFTGLTIKEHTAMDAAEQERRVNAAIKELKLSPEQASVLTAALVATDKAASTAIDPATGQPGVAFKSDDQPPAGFMDTLRKWLKADEATAVAAKAEEVSAQSVDPLHTVIAAQTAQIADLTATLKAAMEAPVEEMAEEEVVEDVPTEEPGSATIGDMTAQEFAELLGTVLSQTLAGAMGGISDKVAALDGEMKAMGYVRQKDDERAAQVAALKTEIDKQQAALAAQQAQLADLVSDAPAIPSTRPSQDPNNILSGLKDADPSDSEFAFADISAHLFGKPGQQPTAH